MKKYQWTIIYDAKRNPSLASQSRRRSSLKKGSFVLSETFRICALIAAILVCLPRFVLAADCIAAAAQYHGINLYLMQAIVMQESGGQPEAINCANRNGSCDFGLTQVNSVHLPRLKTYGVTRNDLFNPCVAAFVGAWILSENFARMGVTWEAVGAYNAGSYEKRIAYARKIHTKVLAIQSGTIVSVTIPMHVLAQIARPAKDAVAQGLKALKTEPR